jgi:hypothetical protein
MTIIKTININRLEPGQEMIVEVNVTKQFKVRLFLAKVLIKFAGFILGCGVKVE